MKNLKIISTVLILMITAAMMAQTPPPRSTVDVIGEGIVNIVPDEVTVNVRVENTGENTKILKEQNDVAIDQVLKFLKKMGIADKDVKTEYINVNKNYDYNTKTYSFAANQSISVKLTDLKKYEELMKGLMDSGINRIDSVEFSSSNKEALESQARKKAVENAQMKAKEYAGVLNQTIGKAISISEFSQSAGPQPMMFKSAMRTEDSSAAQQTIAPGEMEIRTTVNVSFLLN